MKKFIVAVACCIGLFSNLRMNGQSITALPDSVLSQCCLEATLLNGNEVTVAWWMIQYMLRDGTGTKLFVEYAPNFGGVNWETQIRIQNDFDDVLDRSHHVMVPFTVAVTDYAINRNWMDHIEPNLLTGGCWIHGRFGTPTKRKFNAVESYNHIKNILLECEPRAIVWADNGLHMEGDTVHLGGKLIHPTSVKTDGYNLQFIDSLSSVEFGIDYNTAGSGDTTAYFARRFGVYRQLMAMGRTYWTHRLEDTTGVSGKLGFITNGLDSEGEPYMYLFSKSSKFLSWFSQGLSGNSWTFKDLILNPYYTFGVSISPYAAVLGASESGTGDPGNGVLVSANGNGIGADEWIGIRTKNVDNGLAHPGQFLQLVDSITGKVEYATLDLSSYLEIGDTAAMLDPYIQGAGIINRVAKFSASRVITSSNITDDGSRIASLAPFQLAAYDLVSLPTGVTKDMYWVNTQGPAWYQGARLAYALESTFSRGTPNSALYINGNGQITESANYTYTGSLNVYRTSGLTVAQFQTDPAFSGQGWRFKGIASDGRTGLFAYSNNTERRILGARADGAGGVEYLVVGSSGDIGFVGMNASFGLVQNRVYQSGTFFGRGDIGSSLVIAGSGQTTGLGGVSVGQAGATAGVFDLMTETKTAGSTFGLNRNTMRFTAASFLFNADPAPGGVGFQASRMAIGFYNNRILRNTVFGAATVDAEPINIIDAKTTARGSRPFPVLTTTQRNALSGKVIAISMTASGTGYGTTTGYTNIPVTFTGGGGTGAAATAYSFSSGGGVSYASISSEGSGYTSAPTVSFGGAGSGATGTAIITQLVDGVGVYNSDTKTYQYHNLLEWLDFGAKQTDDLSVADTIFNTNPATHAAVDGFATWKSTAQGYALGRATFGSGLSFSGGVLSATGSADGNGIYSGSATLVNHTTRARVPDDGNLLFSQVYNGGADSTYWQIINYGDGERALNFGLTDTASTGYARASFYSDGTGVMNWGFETSSDVFGNTLVRAFEGDLLFSVNTGNISITAPVDSEVSVVGLIRAKQEAYYEINSTADTVDLSNEYSDNFINAGMTVTTQVHRFPASPEDGQILKITFKNAISSLTLYGNGNAIAGSTVTTAVVGSQRVYKFYAGEATWVRQN